MQEQIFSKISVNYPFLKIAVFLLSSTLNLNRFGIKSVDG